MKANELMIGDWVHIDEPDKYAGATGQIQSLMYHREDDAAYFHVFIQGKFGYVSRDVCSDDIRPIPLTPDVLEKNGFVEWRDKCYRWEYAEGIYINVDFTEEEPWVHISNRCYSATPVCRYVHEFQHAMRLCGIEKEIVI